MEYSSRDIALLSDACMSLYFLVAGSDGGVSRAEQQAFIDNHLPTLKSARIFDQFHNELIMECLLQSRQSPKALARRESLDEAAHLATLRRAAALVAAKEPEEGYERYGAQMRLLAQQVAEASKSYWGLGQAVSQAEADMIKKIDLILRLVPSKSR